jgi:uncharacterized protein (TIGR03083 family)
MMPMVHAERRSLAQFLDTLTPEQWAAPTWCDKWNVQDLVAHLCGSRSSAQRSIRRIWVSLWWSPATGTRAGGREPAPGL